LTEPARNKKLFIRTFGCQMNEHDSERIAGILREEGYELCQRPEEADLVILNTCSIRENAEQKAYSELGRLQELKREKRPELIIGVAGCAAQREGEAILKRIPSVDFIFGSPNIDKTTELLKQAIRQRRPAVLVDYPTRPLATLPAVRKDKLRAWVSVMEGCDYRCSFCVVPTTRGPERSRPSREIISEIAQLAEAGYKEVTLLGQTVNSYGKKSDEGVDFADLLRMINDISGIERIRFTTSHPNDLSLKLMAVMADLPKVCEHLHLPLQSGSDRILKIMRRGYSFKEYRSKIDKLRHLIPDLSVTSDIIVGFPGESEEDFARTLLAVSEMSFDGIYAFQYSPRPNTEAASLPDHPPEKIKEERLKQVIDLQHAVTNRRNQDILGTVQEILVEGRNKKSLDKLTGRLRINRVVHFSGPDNLIGGLVRVKITQARLGSFDAELLSA
jgi:tRNA-2-methylthio-N6-dimethylallyladenosine synthase